MPPKEKRSMRPALGLEKELVKDEISTALHAGVEKLEGKAAQKQRVDNFHKGAWPPSPWAYFMEKINSRTSPLCGEDTSPATARQGRTIAAAIVRELAHPSGWAGLDCQCPATWSVSKGGYALKAALGGFCSFPRASPGSYLLDWYAWN